MRRVPAALVLLIVAAWCASAAPASDGAAADPGADAGAGREKLSTFVNAELELRAVIASGDGARLLAFYRDRTRPDLHRAKALLAVFQGKKAPLADTDRLVLVEALSDPSEILRLAAVQAAGETGEQALTQQILQAGAASGSPAFQAQVLRAVRPFIRMTHLYFLETALDSPSEEVRAEATATLGELAMREVPPTLVARVSNLLAGTEPSSVRWAALDTLARWKRLDWEELRGVLLDIKAPEMLRIHALELSDQVPEAIVSRTPVLRDIVITETSLPLAWRAFHRSQALGRGDREYIKSIGRLLQSTPQQNSAAEEMAGFLKGQGVTVELKDGSWEVTGM